MCSLEGHLRAESALDNVTLWSLSPRYRLRGDKISMVVKESTSKNKNIDIEGFFLSFPFLHATEDPESRLANERLGRVGPAPTRPSGQPIRIFTGSREGCKQSKIRTSHQPPMLEGTVSVLLRTPYTNYRVHMYTTDYSVLRTRFRHRIFSCITMQNKPQPPNQIEILLGYIPKPGDAEQHQPPLGLAAVRK
jgi:hypothetical protein